MFEKIWSQIIMFSNTRWQVSRHYNGALILLCGQSLKWGLWKQLRMWTWHFCPSHVSWPLRKLAMPLIGGKLCICTNSWTLRLTKWHLHHCWRREQVLRNIIPESLIPCMSPAEGDCLFCAISLSLFGSYTHNTDLRFAALHYGIIHFDHYLQMVSTRN